MGGITKAFCGVQGRPLRRDGGRATRSKDIRNVTNRSPGLIADIKNVFPLTTAIQTTPATGTAPANQVFTAPAGQSILGAALNTLQSGDVLNGSTGNVLNATIVDGATAIVPTLNNIATVNLTALVPMVGGLNLGLGTTSASTVGDVGSVANTLVTGINTPVTTLNKTGGIARNTTLTASATALAGTTDTLQVNLTGQTAGNLALTSAAASATNGYDTVNIASTGSNTIGQVTTGGSVDAMTLTGGALTIAGGANVNPIDNSVAALTASAMTGALSIGALSATGGSQSVLSLNNVSANYTGSNNGTTLVVAAATLAANDTLRGGSGTTDTLILTGANGAVATAVANTGGAFTASGFETVRVVDSTGAGVNGAAVAIDLANATGVTNLVLNGGAANARTVAFNNFVYGAPVSITATGTGAAGNANLTGANVAFTPVSVFGNTDTVNYTFGNGGVAVGTGLAITSGALTLNNIETLSFTFNDLSVDGAVGTNGSTVGGLALTAGNARSFSVTSTGGSARTANAINFGGAPIGSALGSVTSVLVNSTAGVTAGFNQAAGATFVTSGAGYHLISANNNLAIAVAINGSAGTGNQSLLGGGGGDVILGGTGADTITGNAGGDTITGGAGVDQFGYALTGDSAGNVSTSAANPGVVAVTGMDIITDVVVGETVKIAQPGTAWTAANDGETAINAAGGAAALGQTADITFQTVNYTAATGAVTALKAASNGLLITWDVDGAAAGTNYQTILVLGVTDFATANLTTGLITF